MTSASAGSVLSRMLTITSLGGVVACVLSFETKRAVITTSAPISTAPTKPMSTFSGRRRPDCSAEAPDSVVGRGPPIAPGIGIISPGMPGATIMPVGIGPPPGIIGTMGCPPDAIGGIICICCICCICICCICICCICGGMLGLTTAHTAEGERPACPGIPPTAGSAPVPIGFCIIGMAPVGGGVGTLTGPETCGAGRPASQA